MGERIQAVQQRLRPTGLLYTTYERRLLASLDKDRLPHHVAVMADGNRRWARLNAPGETSAAGYEAGAMRLAEFASWCDDVGIGIVTLWVLSPNNLDRADDEVGPLLDVIVSLVESLAAHGQWKVQLVGALDLLPDQTAQALRGAAQSTEANTGMHINVAVSYAGRHELRDAFRSLLAKEASKGTTLEELSETVEIDMISDHLYTAGQPDPDLIIRTSGEQRLSDFLIWQSAHSEFYFHEALWPDFRRVDFLRALRVFAQRERRFGR
ncbi:MAG: isoprenyl transferase [Propionibacteriaceae bacterium]|nr:isoprenyl transferase [Propionibacteriaceae bacterium]